MYIDYISIPPPSPLGARRDKDGYIWVTGRIDDMLNVSGHLLSTAQVSNPIPLSRHQVISSPNCLLVYKGHFFQKKNKKLELSCLIFGIQQNRSGSQALNAQHIK